MTHPAIPEVGHVTIDGGQGARVLRWDDFASFLAYADATHRNARAHPDEYRGEWLNPEQAIAGSRLSWWGRPGMVNWRAMHDALAGAWPEGAERVAGLVAEFTSDIPAPRDRRRRGRWDAHDGDDLDRDRLYAGADPWRTTRRVSVTAPRTITVLAGMGGLSGWSADACFNAPAAALAYADLAERAGYRVELWAAKATAHAYHYPDRDRGAAMLIGIKPAGMPLDIATAAQACSPVAFRGAIWTAYNWPGRKVSLGAGTTVDIPEEMARMVDPAGGPVEVFHPRLAPNASRADLRAALARLDNAR